MTSRTGVRTTVDIGTRTRTDSIQIAQLATLAGLGWLGVGLSGAWEIAERDWPYLLFAIVLLLAAVLTIATAWSCTGETERSTLHRVGLGAGAVAVASTVAAWALPLWMTTIAVCCAVFAVAAPRAFRPGLAALAVGQLVGLGVMVVAIAAEVGPQDSYGDYPVAFGIGLVITAAVSVLGLAALARAARS